MACYAHRPSRWVWGYAPPPPRKMSCLEVDSSGFWEVSHYQNTTLIHVFKLIHIAIEGPELSSMDFNEILDVFKLGK